MKENRGDIMLQEILSRKKCFKLVCGAGNEDAVEVEKLVTLYAKAGANYFDLSAREDVVLAAQRALRNAVPASDLGRYLLNVSVGMKGDPHVSKARINADACVSCGICLETCIHKAVLATDGSYSINALRCIGCGDCIKTCPEQCITAYSEQKPLREVLPPLVALGIHSIELHAVTDDDAGIDEQWKAVTGVFNGMLSLCIDRSRVSDVQLIGRIKRLILERQPYSTIIQADGAPMSGCDDKPETTLQALATAQVVQRAKLPVYLMLSGGTNSKTAELARFFGIEAHGVALGSYARMIVREWIDRSDFLTNESVFAPALVRARDLVERTLRFMG